MEATDGLGWPVPLSPATLPYASHRPLGLVPHLVHQEGEPGNHVQGRASAQEACGTSLPARPNAKTPRVCPS